MACMSVPRSRKYASMQTKTVRAIAFCVAAVLPASCVGSPTASVPAFTNNGIYGGLLPNAASARYIKHIVVIVQEQRSFEDVFAGFKGADAPTYGYEKQPQGKVYKVDLQTIGWHAPRVDAGLQWELTAYDDGKMDQFNLVPLQGIPSGRQGVPHTCTSIVP